MPLFDPEQYAAAMPAEGQPFYDNMYATDAALAASKLAYYKQLEDAVAASKAQTQKMQAEQAAADATAVEVPAESTDTAAPATTTPAPVTKTNPLGRTKEQQELDKAKSNAAQSNFAKTWLPTQTVEPGVTNIEQFYELPYSRREALVNARVDAVAAENKLKPEDAEKLRAESMKTITYVDNGGKPLSTSQSVAGAFMDPLDTAVTTLGNTFGGAVQGLGTYFNGDGATGRAIKKAMDWSDNYSAARQDAVRLAAYEKRKDAAAQTAASGGFLRETTDSMWRGAKELLASPAAKLSEVAAQAAPYIAGGWAGVRAAPKTPLGVVAGGLAGAGAVGLSLSPQKAADQSDAMVAVPRDKWVTDPEYGARFLALEKALGDSEAAKRTLANEATSTPSEMAINAASGVAEAGADRLLGGVLGFSGVGKILGSGKGAASKKILGGLTKEQLTEQPFSVLDQYRQNLAVGSVDPSVLPTDNFGNVVGQTAIDTVLAGGIGAAVARAPAALDVIPALDPAPQNVAGAAPPQPQQPPADQQPQDPPPATKDPLSDAALKAEVLVRVQEREHATPEEIIANATSPLTAEQINAVKQASATVDAISEPQLNAMGIFTKPTIAQKTAVENAIRKEHGMPEIKSPDVLQAPPIVVSETRPAIDATGMTRDQIVKAHAMDAFSGLMEPAASLERDTPKEYAPVRRTPMTDAANAAAARGAAADMFSAIGDDTSLPKFQRGIAKHIAPMMGEVELKIETDTMTHESGAIESGSYNPALRRIRLARDGGLNVETAIHEGMHATTLHVMRTPKERLNPRQRQGVNEINEVYDHLKTLPQFADEYAGRNAEEMVSEAFSNELAREKMRAVPWKSKSAWTSLTTAIRDALGLPSSIPENALDAIIRASEAVVSAPVAMDGRSASAVRRELPPGYEEKPKKEAKPVEEPHQKVRRMFVTQQADGGGTYRGSALYSPSTRKWTAVFYGADATGAPRTFTRTLDSMTQATDWLQKFGGTVFLRERDAGATGNIKGFIDKVEALTPGAQKFYTAMSTMPVLNMLPESVIQGLTRGLSAEFVQRQTRKYVSRFAGLDRLQKLDPNKRSSPLGLGANAVGLAKANAVGERTMPGFAEKSWFDHTQDTAAHVKGMQALGIGDATISDFVYAVTAQGRNRINEGKMPTDIAGREKSQDYARFSYFEDGAGNIVNVPMGAVPPLGTTQVSGLGAPEKFFVQFAKQFPGVVPVASDFLNTWRAGNERLIALRLANGSITNAEAESQRAEPYFAPLRQPVRNVKARVGGASGRSTKALDPLQQWLAVGDARVEAAFASGVWQDIRNALLENPNPAIATLSAVDAKLIPVRDSDLEEGDTPESGVKWVNRDWVGEDSVLIRDGNSVEKLTFTDKNIAAALRAATTPDELTAVRNALQLSTRVLTATRTGLDPAFWAKQMAWDPMMVVLNAQGAYGKDASGVHNVDAVQSTKLMATILTNAYKELAQSAKTNYKVGLGALDPMRTYYNSKGGGIAFAATVGLDASDSMLSPTPRSILGKVGSGIVSAVDNVMTVGHLMSDALRYQTFKSYLTMRNGGVELKTVSEISDFMKRYPDAEAIALQASKDILGNFERMGQNVWLRAVFPYFNAALVGTTQVLPQILGSRHGKVAVATLTGIAIFAAYTAMQGDDDETDDGRSKYLDSAKAWTGIAINGGANVVPLPPEMAIPLAAANVIAAAVAGKPNVMKTYQGNIAEAFLSLAPIKPAPGENSPWYTAFGAVAYPLLALEGKDQFGRPLANQQPSEKQLVDDAGNKLDITSARLEPDYMRGTQRDPAWAIKAAEGIYDLTGGGIDALPGTYRLWAEAFSGGLMSYATAYQNAELEGGDGAVAAFANLAKGYAVKPNAFGVRQRFEKTAEKVYEEEHLRIRHGDLISPEGQLLQETNTTLKELRSPLGLTRTKVNKELLGAKVAGDSVRYQDAKGELDALNKESSIIMGRTIKMLD